MNSDLATLTDTEGAIGADTITVDASDSLGGAAAQQQIAVTVNGAPVITAPASVAVGVGETGTISGVSLGESGNTSNETFTVTLADANGDLSASGSGVSGAGTTNLTITGSLSQVNSDLATLTDTDGATGSDTITLNASDSLGGAADQQSIAVTVNGVPETVADSYTGLLDGALTVAAADGVLANDSTSSSGGLTASLNQPPVHGTLTLNQDGSFTYAPATGFVGTDTFTYIASDGVQASNPTTVSLDIAPATISIDAPAPLSPGETGTATIHYTASAAAPANLLLVQMTGALVADPLTGEFSNSALVFAPAGNVSGGVADIPVTIEMGLFSASPPSISVSVADPTQTIDWSAQEAALKPAGMDDATWGRVFANFSAEAGSTVGSLTQALAADAALLSSFGIDAQSGSAALAFELEQAGDFGSLAARGATGSLGQGWTTIADVGLSLGADGSVTLLGPADLLGLFTLDATAAGAYTLSDWWGARLRLMARSWMPRRARPRASLRNPTVRTRRRLEQTCRKRPRASR